MAPDINIEVRELPFSDAPPNIKTVYDYWIERRGRHRMPSRADIDPIDLRSVLAWISLIEIRPTAPRFFIRVAAGNLNNPFGTQNGRDLSVIRLPNYRATLEKYWTLVAETGVPRFDEFDLQFQSYTLVYRRLALPLGANHETSDTLLLCSHFDDPIRQKLFHEAFDRAADANNLQVG
jgi:hypothetical protein